MDDDEQIANDNIKWTDRDDYSFISSLWIPNSPAVKTILMMMMMMTVNGFVNA